MKKALCMLLALIFMVGTIPAFADEGEAVRVVYENITYEIKDGQATAVSADKEKLSGQVVIPQSVEGCPVTELGNYLFKGSSITKAEVPEGVKKINYGAFDDCKNLEEISLPESLEIIGGYTFFQCSMLKEISLPKGLRVIGERAFQECALMEEMHLPENLEKIEDYALPRYVKKKLRWMKKTSILRRTEQRCSMWIRHPLYGSILQLREFMSCPRMLPV